jgi:hypothetical protein
MIKINVHSLLYIRHKIYIPLPTAFSTPYNISDFFSGELADGEVDE